MDLKSGLPYSLIKNGLVNNYPKLEKNIKADVVIMGGGISGALIAYQLTKRNIPCVTIDARSIGHGSTCASTSLLQYEIDTPLYKLSQLKGRKKAFMAYRACKVAVEKLLETANKIGFNNVQRKSSLYYASYKKDSSWLYKEYEMRKECGLPVQFLKKEELNRHTGIAAPAAIISEGAAQTDAYMLTHHLHQHNIKKGQLVFDRSPITNIEHTKRNVHLTTENGCKIEAKKLVYATGYETVNFIDKRIVKLLSTYAVASEAKSDIHPFWKNDMLIWNTANPYLYLRTTVDGRIIVGGRDENFYSPQKRDTLLLKKTKQLITDFKILFPDISFLPEFSWTGTFGTTTDGLPFIGTYPKLTNSFFALGYGGNGIVFSQIASEILADMVAGKKNKYGDLFSFGRV